MSDGQRSLKLNASTDAFIKLGVDDGTTEDSNYRFELDAAGKLEWGSGSGAIDTNLYRSAANELKTDDVFDANGGLKIAGTAVDATAAEINRAADVSGRIVNATAATLTVTEATHEGKTIVLDRAAGITVTLPAATGGGGRYKFYTKTTVTSNNHIIQVVVDDVMKGTCWMANDTDGSVSAFETASDSDTITMNGTTKGGLVGDVILLEDIAADTWSVQCFLQGTGTEATPFSAAVS